MSAREASYRHYSTWNWLGGKVLFNFVARDEENVDEVMDACEGHALIGVLAKDFDSIDAACAQVDLYSRRGTLVSLGLGGGEPGQWRKVVEISRFSRPAHVNQVWPLSAYTLGTLKERFGDEVPLVNALVSPSGTPGLVDIATGPYTAQKSPAVVPAEFAVALLKEQQLSSLKFFPLNNRLEQLGAVSRECAAAGIDVVEPTGGVNSASLSGILEAALAGGVNYVIPHIYTAIVDKSTGKTKPYEVKKLYETAKKVFGLG